MQQNVRKSYTAERKQTHKKCPQGQFKEIQAFQKVLIYQKFMFSVEKTHSTK